VKYIEYGRHARKAARAEKDLIWKELEEFDRRSAQQKRASAFPQNSQGTGLTDPMEGCPAQPAMKPLSTED